MERLTTNNPQTNIQTLMNYAYAKDGRVCLRHADGQEEKDLCEYIASRSPEMCGGVTPESVMEGECMECDCPLGILNTVATQAAELRGRLKLLEDILGDNYDPSRLRQLAEADREGKVEIHSLAIGTSFFFLRPSCTRGGIAEKGAYMPSYLECQKCKGPCDKSLIVDSAKTRTFAEGDSLLIGVNAFITKEAAEKALEEQKC